MRQHIIYGWIHCTLHICVTVITSHTIYILLVLWLFYKGLMHVNGRPVSAFDPEGLIFAAGVDSEMIKLYDLRSFDKVRRLPSPFPSGTLFKLYMLEWWSMLWIYSKSGLRFLLQMWFRKMQTTARGTLCVKWGILCTKTFTVNCKTCLYVSRLSLGTICNSLSTFKVAFMSKL